MMKKRIAAACIVVAGLAAAVCMTHKQTTENTQTEALLQLEPEELTVCLIGSAPTDMDMVLEKFNQLTKEDLNCTINIKWIGWGDYATQYPMTLSSGDAVDLIYAASWLDFWGQAQRGAFAPLEDLLAEYAPLTFAELSETAKGQATIDGHLYAAAANYTSYNSLGPIVRGDLMEKYQLEDIESFDDYLNYCEVIATNEELDPTGMCTSDICMDDLYLMSLGYYPVTGATGSPYWVDLNDKTYPVYFRSECPEMETYLKQAQTWYEKGYWSDNVLANKNELMLADGEAASRIHNFDAYMGEYGKHTDWQLRYYNLAAPLVRQSHMQDAMAVPADSKHKERAVMLLEKLRTDKEYYMLLNYGIEGYHYECEEDTHTIQFLNTDYGNEPGTWGFREEAYRYWDGHVPEDAMQMRKNYEEQAIDISLSHLQLDLRKINEQYAAIERVMSVYYNPLKLGYLSYEEGIEALAVQLEEAGNTQVKAELQRQITEYIQKNTVK